MIACGLPEPVLFIAGPPGRVDAANLPLRSGLKDLASVAL